jgi:hypothetical protein
MVFPPGIYYIGDISYAFDNSDDYWDLEDLITTPTYSGFLHNGKYTIGKCSLPGDGFYIDTKGREYGVDRVNIGIVPIELVTADSVDRLGKVFQFNSPFEFGFEPIKYIWVKDRTNPAKSFEIIIDEEYYDY